MKRKIGKLALVGVAISLFLWMIIVFTGVGLDSDFPVFPMVVFASWGISFFTAIFCFAGDVISFIGKMFASGYNSVNNLTVPNNTKFCPSCGKQINSSSAFCSNCGKKLN